MFAVQSPGRAAGIAAAAAAAAAAALVAQVALAAPAAVAPGPDAVAREVREYETFLAALSRGASRDGRPSLAVSVRVLRERGQYTLVDEDVKHLGAQREALRRLEWFKTLDPALVDYVLQTLTVMTEVQNGPPGETDPKAIESEARLQVDRWTIDLAEALDEVASSLAAKQRQAGLAGAIPSLWRPPAPGAPGTAPAPLPLDAVDRVVEAVGRGATSAGDVTDLIGPDAGAGATSTGPCADQGRSTARLAREGRGKEDTIRSLIGAGDRALGRRYFGEARDAYEAATDATVDLEERTHRVLTETLDSIRSDEDRLTPDCTRIVSETLSRTTDLKDLLRGVHPRLGRAYFELGEFAPAADQIRRSVEIDPGDARTWAALGQAEDRRGESGEAVEAFRNSVRLDAYEPDRWLELARAHARAGESGKAIAALRKAISRGFVRFDDVDRDPDFEVLRDEQEFQELILLAPGQPR
jgi:tetratricopeptide (TPR) repeat protein